MNAAGRTFAIGDIHGEADALRRLLEQFPDLGASDTLVFIGDYLDRGPESQRVVEILRGLGRQLSAKVVCLRGNHEDAWLHMVDRAWPDCIQDYLRWEGNGCIATYRSYTRAAPESNGESVGRRLLDSVLGQHPTTPAEQVAMSEAAFFPPEHLTWLRSLPMWYEDEHAIYVHAGLVPGPAGFLAPSEVEISELCPGGPRASRLLWGVADNPFFSDYVGKLTVFGHTPVGRLPRSSPERPNPAGEVWQRDDCIGLDTGSGKGGLLSAIELPSRRVYQAAT